MKVSDLMTPKVKTLQRNEMLSLAEQLMSLERIRHLPVLDEDGQLAGIVSQRDLFHSGLFRALGHGKHSAARVRDACARDATREGGHVDGRRHDDSRRVTRRGGAFDVREEDWMPSGRRERPIGWHPHRG